jgi:1,4-dihydroxy-2-naphthoate octaprenyltransferase
LVLIGFASLVLFSATHFRTWWQYVFILSFVAMGRHLRFVMKNTEPRALDPHMKFLALTTLVTALLFSLGLVLAA